jgi:CubicO group peptidase (beta-lactamase class C family)
MEEKIKNLALQAIKEQVFPGCAIGVVHKNSKRSILPLGNFTYDPASPKIQPDSIFDVASITKIIPTSALALKLINEGKLKLTDKLIDFVPEFRNSDRERVLIKHLLTQTLDYNFALSEFKDKSPTEILDLIFTTDFKSQPGKKFFYVNASSILLGLVVQRILKAPLDKLGEEYFFKSLKMTNTLFNPLTKIAKDKIVPTEIEDWRGGLIQGEVHDESTYVLQQKEIVGAAGLFSTAPDLLNFLEMILNEGSFNGQQYFSKEIVKQMHTNQIAEINEWTGLGWELNQPRFMGQDTQETFGKTGFTGCLILGNIKKETGLVILSNAVYPKRKLDSLLINNFRRNIADIVFRNV